MDVPVAGALDRMPLVERGANAEQDANRERMVKDFILLKRNVFDDE